MTEFYKILCDVWFWFATFFTVCGLAGIVIAFVCAKQAPERKETETEINLDFYLQYIKNRCDVCVYHFPGMNKIYVPVCKECIRNSPLKDNYKFNTYKVKKDLEK